HVDAAALGVGAAATVVLILVAALWPAWRAGAATVSDVRAPTKRKSRAASVLAEASFPPTAVAGVRMALEPGSGGSAVPVRTTIAGTILALTALTASLGFGASLQRLVGTPSLSGWNYDAIFAGNTPEGIPKLA